MLKCSDMMESGKTKDLKPMVRQLYMLDAACDAANAHFMKSNAGGTMVGSSDELQECAFAGVTMLHRALSIPGDPMKIRPTIDKKVTAFIGLLIKRVAQERERRAAAKAQQAQRREHERRAEEAALAEAARKRTRHNAGAMLLVATLLLFGVFAFGR